MSQLSAKNIIWNFLWNVLNFALIFYVIRALNKKSRQSLKLFPESFRWDILLIIGTRIVKGLTKNVPLRKVWDSSHFPLTALTIKVVYLVSYSWYGQTFAPVCTMPLRSVTERKRDLIYKWGKSVFKYLFVNSAFWLICS